MKGLLKFGIVALVLCLLTGWSASLQAEDKPKTPAPAEKKDKPAEPVLPKLAVNTLAGKGVKADLGTLTDVLCTRLMTYKKYQILCASDIQAILASSQQSALMGSCDDDKCTETIAKIVHADLTVNGNIGKVENSYVISLSLISVADQKSLKRVTHEVSADAGKLIDGIREAADKLVK